MATRVKKTGKLVIPEFPKTIRDEILNYTDDKEHASFIGLVDSTATTKVVMGAKNVSKSFGYMIHVIWRLVNEPCYCAVWARNLSIDIGNTLLPTLRKAINFLKIKHNIDYTDFFDIYSKVAVFRPTGQAIFFANFELVNSFAGLTLNKYDFDICEVIFDEIQQDPKQLGSSAEKIYSEQPNDMELIKQSTIMRTKRKPGQNRSMVFLFNIWDSKHWVCEKYVTPTLPFTKENREKLLSQNYLLARSEGQNCIMMRMSRFYVPKAEIDEEQMREYEKLKIENPKLYDITIAGEPYDQEDNYYIYPFKRFVYDDENIINKNLLVADKIKTDDIELVIDGFDPGLRDKNGFVRVLLTKSFHIIVYYADEISSKRFSNLKRITTTEYILEVTQALNRQCGVADSILAIDSKEDTIIELAIKYISEKNLSISPCKAIKNKNPVFQIDFNISNRAKFLIECFQRGIIKFTFQTQKLLQYIAMQAFDENWKRDEKINSSIYDLVNAFEYSLSLIYPMIITEYQIIEN